MVDICYQACTRKIIDVAIEKFNDNIFTNRPKTKMKIDSELEAIANETVVTVDSVSIIRVDARPSCILWSLIDRGPLSSACAANHGLLP